MSNAEIVDLMFLVKTYPQPSSKYQTLVCSAGLTEDGRWFRLYPLKFEQFIGDSKITWRKLRERFFDFLVKERDLHFIVGTHSRFPTWMIIGSYYPPMEMERSKNLTLDRF